ncbi:hypothetical protein BS50DRAFT_388029 [Corynespora cassiicola Philippines]|uniref:Uncharacterized protein n=1 Tax=Corynespora cassiicola Philippines TaxID=1448308 RepID=A0A2T2NPU1_CORCC|nr:hypothetical protein BS50DRAFT_388029 [Corynespora cassiicola Philippines]
MENGAGVALADDVEKVSVGDSTAGTTARLKVSRRSATNHRASHTHAPPPSLLSETITPPHIPPRLLLNTYAFTHTHASA